VILDGAFGEMESSAISFVGNALRQHGEHLLLALRQRVECFSGIGVARRRGGREKRSLVG